MLTKQKIIAKCLELFSRYGIRMMNMDDLAKELGVSKKTIYAHYREKNEIITDCVSSILQAVEGEIRKIIVCSDNPIQKTCDIYAICLQVILEYPPTFFYDLRRFHDNGNALLKEFRENFLKKTIIGLLNEGKKEGFVLKNIDENFICDLHLFRFLEFLDNRDAKHNFVLEDIFRHLVITSLRGILSPQHISMLDFYSVPPVHFRVFKKNS